MMSDRPLVIGLGELLWDCFDDFRRPGGAPANVAFQANQLGCRGTICSRLGRDELGEELTSFLDSQEVSTRDLQFDVKRPTGTVSVEMLHGDHPQYAIHEDVAWDAMDDSPEWQQVMHAASAVCFGTLAQRSEPSHSTIQKCLTATREDCLIVYDVNLRQDYFSRPVIEESLQACRVVKLNLDEVGVIQETLELTSTDSQAFAKEVQSRFGVELVVITRGDQGCLLISSKEVVDVPGEKIEVADAVGAGDAFTAGLISALLQNSSLQTAGAFANRVGARVAASSGAMPDLKGEFEDLRKEFFGSI
jgi:fructokinase